MLGNDEQEWAKGWAENERSHMYITVCKMDDQCKLDA